jgi:hypothetical protein
MPRPEVPRASLRGRTHATVEGYHIIADEVARELRTLL